MIQACGRYGFDIEGAWQMTPREFGELVEGGRQAEREQRLGVAMIISTIHAALGTRTSPLTILGEDADRESADSPFPGDTKLEKYNRMRARARQNALREAQAWRPRDFPVEGEAPPWFPRGVDLDGGDA
jgi:hypothetical protein